MPTKTKKTENKDQVEKIEEKLPVTEKATYYEALGRRREASARVRLYVVTGETLKLGDKELAKGAMTVNNRDAEKYFPGEVYKKMYFEPFRTTNTVGRFVTTILVTGGGLNGQLGAVIHAISRALLKVDLEKFRPILKKRGFLKRDPRAKQRRKAGFAGKARARKQSPKR